MATDEWQTTKQVSEETNIPESTLRYLKHRGAGPRIYKIGRKVLYKRSDVLAWMETQAVEPRQAVS